MWQDPIVEETRNLRKQYSEKFNNIDEIFTDIRQRQEKSKHKRVSFPARKSITPEKSA